MVERDLTMAFDPDYEVIIAAYDTNDDLGKVIRAHFAIERQIERLITTQSNAKVDGRTSFFGKVNLLRAMRVSEKLCIACEAINDLRNQFAHNPEATVANTKSISDKFLVAVEGLSPILPQLHGKIVKKSAGIEHDFTYDSATQAQRVVLAAALVSAIVGALPKMLDFGRPKPLAVVSGVSL